MIGRFTEQYTNGGMVLFAFDLFIDAVDVEIQLPGKFRLEIAHLQLKYHETIQVKVEEKQVGEKVIACHVQVELVPDISKAPAKFQQKFADMLNLRSFHFTFLGFCIHIQEIKEIGVFQRFRGKVGLWIGQGQLKIAQCLALPLE